MKTTKNDAKKYVDSFNSFSLRENVLVKIGDFVLSKKDLDTKYKSKIVKHFGEYNDDSINNSLWTLYDIQKLYNDGGYIYRVVWLENESDFDKEKLGSHWLSNKGDVENIVYLFSMRDNTKGEPYYIKAYTPPKNVSVPHDYFNNLEENEVLVIDDTKLTSIELFKIK